MKQALSSAAVTAGGSQGTVIRPRKNKGGLFRKKRRSKVDLITDIVFIVLLVVIALVALYPLWFVVIASISDPMAIARGEVIFWPKDISWEAYETLLNNGRIWIGYRNSLFYLFAGSFTTLAVTLPAAYALSRKKLKGRRVINFLFIVSMYFSGGIVPTYLLHQSIGWLDTIWVMIIPSALNVYYMILARSSFDSLPETMYEAAAIDGANDFRFFLQFALPLCKATIAVLFLFSALSWWNEYMRFIIYISDKNLQSLQVVIREITQSLSSALTETMTPDEILAFEREKELLKYSVVVVAALPFCLLYPFIQKYFNRGVMVGAIKG